MLRSSPLPLPLLLAPLLASLCAVSGVKAQRLDVSQDVCDPEARLPSWCHLPPGEEDSILLCFYAEPGRLCEVRAPRQRIIPPNTSVRVIVEHQRGQEVSLSMGGQRGLYTPAAEGEAAAIERALRRMRGGRSDSLLGEEARAEGEASPSPSSPPPPPPPPRRVTTMVFGPRLPGEADVQVRVLDEGSSEAHQSNVELHVEQTYSAALRIGFGMAFGNAVDRRYQVSTVPGSGQPEVVATGGGVLDIELVVGFAPFLETFWGGRGYQSSRHLERFPFGLSPYVGVALLGSTSEGADFLTSFYLGLEFEPARGFSVALTTVARRVTRLLPGVHVGDAADSDGAIARKGYEFGWGLVINVSPDFLQATGSLIGAPGGG